MTVLDDDRDLIAQEPMAGRVLRERASAATRGPVQVRRTRRGPARPAVTPLRYRRTGVALSRAPHARQSVSTPVSVGLACAAALITLLLGALAQLSGVRSAGSAPASGQLVVVQVQAGETLQHIAGRVAPGSPAAEVVERIRELNKLESTSVDVGQTLITPLG